MIDQLAKQLFNDLKHTIDNNVPNAELSASQIKAVIESGLRKLNLVTREEFDAQSAVLLRTRERLEALEKHIEKLESSLT